MLVAGHLLSCNSRENIEGTWIGAYSYYNISDSANHLPERIVVTFEVDKYFAKRFKYDYRSKSDVEKGTYSYNDGTIFFNSDNPSTAVLDIISRDSLVIKGLEGANNTVYKRLSDTLKSRSQNIDLAGKRFLRTSKNYSDTLNFVNDSLLIKCWDNNTKLELAWERTKHNGFDILFMDLDIPYIIGKERSGTIKLTGLHRRTYDMNLEELD